MSEIKYVKSLKISFISFSQYVFNFLIDLKELVTYWRDYVLQILSSFYSFIAYIFLIVNSFLWIKLGDYFLIEIEFHITLY